MILASSPFFSLEPFETILGQVSEHFRGWEIVAEGKHSLPLVKQKFLELKPSYNLFYQVHAPLSDINIGSANTSMRRAAVREISDCIKLCRDLDIGLVTFHPGHLSPLTIEARQLVQALTKESVGEIAKVGEECGVTLAIENMPKMYITIHTAPDDLLEVIQGTEVRICFDIGHAFTAGTVDDFLRHVPAFRNVHLNDNDGEQDQHKTLGDGKVDFDNVFRGLRGYTGNFVIEVRSIESCLKSMKFIEKWTR